MGLADGIAALLGSAADEIRQGAAVAAQVATEIQQGAATAAHRINVAASSTQTGAQATDLVQRISEKQSVLQEVRASASAAVGTAAAALHEAAGRAREKQRGPAAP